MADERRSQGPFDFPAAGAVIAIFDRESFAQEALPDLQRLSVAGVYLLEGRDLREPGAAGLRQRAVGKSQAAIDEAQDRQRSIARLVDAARGDQRILVVHLASPDQVVVVREAVIRHHAHTIRHFQREAE